MASILKGVVPPLDKSFVPDAEQVMQQISACRNVDDLTGLLTTWANSQINDTSRYAYPLRIGAAYRMATTNKLLGEGADAKERNAALEKAVGYSLVHMRSCARLYDDNNLIAEAIKDYQTHKDRLNGRPRKLEGIDYALGCIKFSKRLRANLKKKMSLNDSLEDADKALPSEREPVVRPLSPQQTIQRKDSVIIALLTLLRLANEDGDFPFLEILDQWRNCAKLIEIIESLAYSEDEGSLFKMLQNGLHLPSAAIYDNARKLLSLLNDARGIADDDDDSEEGGTRNDDGGSGGGSPSGGGAGTDELRQIEHDPDPFQFSPDREIPNDERPATTDKGKSPQSSGFVPVIFPGQEGRRGTAPSRRQAELDAIEAARNLGHTGTATHIRDNFVTMDGDRRNGWSWEVATPAITAPDESRTNEQSDNGEQQNG